MPSLDDYKPEKRFVGLFAGESGSGKSGAAASFEHPYHELDVDNRFGGIADMVAQHIIKDRRLTYQQFDSMGGWEPVSREMKRLNALKLAYKLQPMMQPFPYKTIGLGSLGSLSRVVMALFYEQATGQHVGSGKEDSLRLSHPGDFRAENNGVNQVLDYLFAMPCNLIITCHTKEKWGKPRVLKDGDEYKPNEILGEKLNLTDNLAAGIVGRFDNVFNFRRRLEDKKIKYYCEFASEFAKNSFGIPPGDFEFTDKEFYPWFQELIKKYRRELPPTAPVV